MRSACLLCAGLAACGGTPAPSIGNLRPSVVCGSGTLPVAVHGENFLARPVRTLAGSVALEVPSARLMPATGTTVFPDVIWFSTSLISLRVPLDQLAVGAYLLEVHDPDGQRAQLASALTRVEVPPVIVDRVLPASLCVHDRDTRITVEGAGFLSGASVSIRDGKGEVVLRPQAQVTTTSVTLTLPAASLPPGAYTLVVENPEQNGCIVTAAAPLSITAPPLLSRVESGAVCQDGGQLVVVGSHLQGGAQVEARGVAIQIPASSVDVTSPERAVVTFPENNISHNEDANLHWQNPDGCGAVLPASVRLNPGRGMCD